MGLVMSTLFLAVSAVTPSLLLMWFFHRRDAFPEPARVLWTTFALGVAIMVPVLLVEFPMAWLAAALGPVAVSSFATAFFAAAIPEEVFKFVVLWFYASRHPEFDEPMDGVVYGVAASLGFATLENVLYVSSEGFGVAVSRAILAVPAHALLGAVMGYFVGRARSSERRLRRGLLIRALGWPILLHGLYNYPLIAADALADTPHAGLSLALVPTAPAIVILLWRWTLRLVRRLRAEQDADTVAPVHAVPQTAGGRRLAWVLVVGGGGLASFGGLVTLGLLAAMLGGVEDAETGDLVVGWVVLGLPPLTGGVLAFFRGIVALNRRGDEGAA